MLQICGDKIVRSTRDYTEFSKRKFSRKSFLRFLKTLDLKCLCLIPKHPY